MDEHIRIGDVAPRVQYAADGAQTAGVVHDHGVQGHMAVPVRIAAQADRGVGRVRLGHAGRRLDHVQGRAAALAHPPAFGVGRRAEVPGRGHDDGRRFGQGRSSGGRGADVRRGAGLSHSCAKLTVKVIHLVCRCAHPV